MRQTSTTRALLMTGLGALSIVTGVQPAFAQDASRGENSDAIIVTARKKNEPLIDVPLSLSVIHRSGLNAARLREFSDLAAIVPNLAISGGIGGQLQGQVAIRGIATLARNIGVESGIGIYLDGVYVGRPDAYNQDLLDVERVEVLRGPQGTLFGKNTIAGVLNIVSAAPTPDLSGSLLAEAGGFGLVRTQAIVSGPLAGEQAAGRIALSYVTRAGFDRHLSGGRAADDEDRFSWRGALALAPWDNVAISLRTDGLRERSVPGFFSATDLAFPIAPATLPRGQIDNNRPDRLDRDLFGGSLTTTIDWGAATLTGVTGYRHSRYAASVDDDQRQIDLMSADDFGDRSKLWSQEIRIAGSAGEHLSYLAGVYLLDQVVTTDRVLALGQTLTTAYGLPSTPRLTTRGRVTTRSFAGFGNVDWRLLPRLTLALGLRYTHERKRARFIQDDETGIFTLFGLPDLTFQGRTADHDLSPTVSLDFRAAPALAFYVRLARGFKSAAFNVDLASSLTGLSAGPEHATTYEGGIKAFPGGATVMLSVFRTSYKDLQVAQVTGSGTALNNAAEASVRGFEFETSFSPVKAIRLQGSLGLADTRYDRFDTCARPLSEGGGPADCTGKRLTGAPRFTAAAAAEYSRQLGWAELSARIELNHRSTTFFDPTNSPRFRGRARTLVNARLGLRRGRLTASAWIENLTDLTYETYRDDRTALGVLRTTAYGPPRTWGVSLAQSF